MLGLIIMVVGWLLIIVAAFGSGFDLRVGNLHSLELGEVLVLLALCIGVVLPITWPGRRAA